MRRCLIVLLFAIASMTEQHVATAATSGGAIAIAVANGEFRLDGYEFRSNVTILEGSIVDTLASPAHISMNAGVQIDLAAGSRAQLFRQQLVLYQGSAQCSGLYSVAADGLRITATTASATYRISLVNKNTLQLSVISGNALVKDSQENTVAFVTAGSNLELMVPQNRQSNAFRLMGCIRQSLGRLLLRDDITNVVVSLRGANVAKAIGYAVEVVGTGADIETTAPNTSPIVEATTIVPQYVNGCTAEDRAIRSGTNFRDSITAVVAGTLVTRLDTAIGVDEFLGGRANEIGPTMF